MTCHSNRLKQVRTERGLNQYQLAKKCRLAQSEISRYESEYAGRTDVWSVIADALNVSPAYLVGWSDERS
ncbi:helix-turn-helix domain-containing protein [Eupransor demetentiae]|uniref:helix-turn-helix domain-containing protein n=1 Tax=Eupransor demetentiae TaxID=3109584 RepID=UPI0033130025